MVYNTPNLKCKKLQFLETVKEQLYCISLIMKSNLPISQFYLVFSILDYDWIKENK